MSTSTIRMPEDKHERLKALARANSISINKLIDELATVALANCDACRHDYLIAYSCKTRYFCPSCHQKRVLLYAEWVEANVLAPVAHRQYVFTVPKLVRSAFERQRAWLGELCRIATRLLLEAYA